MKQETNSKEFHFFYFKKISKTVESLFKLIKGGKENINSKIINAAGKNMEEILRIIENDIVASV